MPLPFFTLNPKQIDEGLTKDFLTMLFTAASFVLSVWAFRRSSRRALDYTLSVERIKADAMAVRVQISNEGLHAFSVARLEVLDELKEPIEVLYDAASNEVVLVPPGGVYAMVYRSPYIGVGSFVRITIPGRRGVRRRPRKPEIVPVPCPDPQMIDWFECVRVLMATVYKTATGSPGRKITVDCGAGYQFDFDPFRISIQPFVWTIPVVQRRQNEECSTPYTRTLLLSANLKDLFHVDHGPEGAMIFWSQSLHDVAAHGWVQRDKVQQIIDVMKGKKQLLEQSSSELTWQDC